MLSLAHTGVPMIIGEIRRHLRDNNPIRVSRSIRDLAYKALQSKEKLTKENEKEPTIEQIAKEIGIPKEETLLKDVTKISDMPIIDDDVILKRCAVNNPEKRRKAELLFHRVGITFNVYGNNEGTERLIPFDPIPRIISAEDWKIIDAGIKHRVTALNMFLYDIYHEGHILKSGIICNDIVFTVNCTSINKSIITIKN